MLAILAFATCACAAAEISIWPRPRSVSFAGPPIRMSPGIELDANVKSPVLEHGLANVQASIRAHKSSGPNTKYEACSTIKIHVHTHEETLTSNSDYSYSLTVLNGTISIYGGSVYGAFYGLTSLAQMLSPTGELPHDTVTVHDSPDYAWRGVMIDAGRRFFPVSLVENLLDTMAAVKMNVLHLHASDHCRFSVESKVVPNLTNSLTGDYAGHYTQSDIKALIKYAQLRGIRVVPEFDIPGHARGWLPAQSAGLHFCTNGTEMQQMYNDPGNQTLRVVASVFKEMANLFPDEVFHIGADETSQRGVCSVQSTFGFEQEVLRIVQSYGKTGEGWEELYFDVHAGMKDAIINAWSRHTAKDVTALGRKVVENKADHFYFTSSAPGGPKGWSKCWYDIATGVPDSEKPLLLGAEVSMWTDTYLPTSQCGAFPGGPQVGAALFPPSRDAEFSKSIGGMMWPRGFVAAQAFWHYNASTDPASVDFVTGVWKVNEYVRSKGGHTCPTNCSCDQLTACDKPYIHEDALSNVMLV